MKEKMKLYFTKYFSNSPKIIFIVVLLIMGVAVGVYSTRKTVVVSIDGKETSIVTYNNTFGKALSSNKIIVGPKDKTTPNLDSRVNDGDKIYIKRAVNVEVAVDGKQLKLLSAEDNITNMFEAENLVVDDFDKVAPARETPLTDGLKVLVTRVKTEIVKESKVLDFTSIQKQDDNMEKGQVKILQEGQQGQEDITTKIVYEDGKVVAKQVVSQIVVKQPVQKITAVGILGAVPNLSRGGNKVLYKKSLRMVATAYSPEEVGGQRTATGTTPKRNKSGYSTIAVDPRVIPLGTRVYVDGYGYAIAEDTGGGINGNKIDVFVNSLSECYSWGVRNVTVYILK